MGEPVLAAITGLSQGILGSERYVMIITSQRLVFLHQNDEDFKLLRRKIREDSKNHWGGYFKGKDVNLLMRTYPRNVSVMVQNVKKLKLLKSSYRYSFFWMMRVKASGYNEKFRFGSCTQEQRDALKNLLGKRFKRVYFIV